MSRATLPTPVVKEQKKQHKVISKVESPFAQIKCPRLSGTQQATISKLLCELLAPLGEYRRARATATRRAKRKHAKLVDDSLPEKKQDAEAGVPDFAQCVLIGVNSVTRQLESEIAHKPGEEVPTKLALILVTGSSDSMLYSHLPMMCFLASDARPAPQAVRLVFLEGLEAQISHAVGLPRAGIIGVIERNGLDCSTAVESLLAFGRGHLSPVRSPLLEDSAAGVYRPVKIS